MEAITAPVQHSAPPPKVFSSEELFRGLALAHPEAQARELATAISADLDQPGTMWAIDNVLLIALLSAEHERRAAEFLQLGTDDMKRELIRVRTHLVRRGA